MRDRQRSLALPLLPFLPGPSTDYQTLRIGGLVFAVVFFSVGILLILSKFLCSSRKSRVSAQRWGERAAWEPVCSPCISRTYYVLAHNRCSVKQGSTNKYMLSEIKRR